MRATTRFGGQGQLNDVGIGKLERGQQSQPQGRWSAVAPRHVGPP